jgi:RNA polymerase sigma-70 factor (ECF subfamily)
MENEGLIRLMDNEPTLEAIIKKAIDKLGDEQRSCIQLFFFQNKSYKDIVEMTPFTEKQVKSFLQNGKRKLKILLEEDILKRKSN